MARLRKNFGKYTYVVFDNEPITRIRLRIEGNLLRSMKQLRDLYRYMLSTWGSLPLVGGSHYRVRVRHSSPGNPPFRQTENLRNSIQVAMEIHARTFGSAGGIGYFSSVLPRKTEGIVGTDVPYAPTLELGGMSSANPPKPYATADLINPLLNPVAISPRPFWRKGFAMFIPKLLSNLKRGGRGPIFRT